MSTTIYYIRVVVGFMGVALIRSQSHAYERLLLRVPDNRATYCYAPQANVAVCGYLNEQDIKKLRVFFGSGGKRPGYGLTHFVKEVEAGKWPSITRQSLEYIVAQDVLALIGEQATLMDLIRVITKNNG